MRRPVNLAGLFFAVWALVLQVSLPLATQLSPATGAGTYDLIAATTGRIHSGHGTPSRDHSLPVQPDIKAILIKTDPPGLHGAEFPAALPLRAITVAAWPVRGAAAPAAAAFDHARLSRAPPSFRHGALKA